MVIANALTVDLEDWYHGCCGRPVPAVPPEKRRLRGNLDLILELLDRFQARATFFVLGSVIEEDPSLVPSLAAAGHEIASHGFSHTPLPLLGPELFRQELRRTARLIELQAGRLPAGFRAPQWSLGTGTPWALPILKEEGYRYDSSLNPLPFVGDRRGRVAPHLIETEAGSLLEFPPMVSRTPALNLPTGGGWGFRFFPQRLIRRTVEHRNDRGIPAVIYLHPRELDPGGPRLRLTPWRSFVSYGPRTDATPRLKRLLRDFAFVTLGELAAQWKPA